MYNTDVKSFIYLRSILAWEFYKDFKQIDIEEELKNAIITV